MSSNRSARRRDAVSSPSIWKVALLYTETLALPPVVADRIRGWIRARDVSSLSDAANIVVKEYRIIHDDLVCQLRQIAALFKKNSMFAEDGKCTEQARRNFELGEVRCKITNKRLFHYYEHEDRMDPMLRKWTSRLQLFVEELLGDPKECVEAFTSLVRLTAGATQDRPRKRAYPFLKVTGSIRAPVRAWEYLKTALLHWGVEPKLCKFTNVDRNSVAFVPKTWKTHRTIAMEPTHSLPFQLGIDAFIKRRLKKVWRIDLSTQGRNQEFARIGSLDGSIATIDLEMASDTLSEECVALAVPPEWFRLLSAFRSLRYKVGSEEGKYAKFSSMGNGYTFALETLIFAAACRAVGAPLGSFTVYGDDIAIRTEYVDDLLKLLKYLGFRVNLEKSFYDPLTQFRESCGCDWLSGRLVTPVYWREPVSSPADLCHLLNGLFSITDPGSRLWEYLLQFAADKRVPKVPFNTDSRSGVWIHPSDASIRSGYLNYADQIPWFKGLVPSAVKRTACGWRSCFLWYLEKRASEGDRFFRPPTRSVHILLGGVSEPESTAIQRNVDKAVGIADTRSVSEVAVRTTYRYGRRVYVPVRHLVPDHIFLMAEDLAGMTPRPRVKDAEKVWSEALHRLNSRKRR